MPDFCTCGAQLPDDARFCHKCGKPQRDEDLHIEEEVAPPPPPPVLPPAPAPIGFRNAVAMRVAVTAGGLASFLSIIVGPLFLLTSILGGFFAVYLYGRRTGQTLTMANGARLGWISGIFGFLLLAAVVAVQVSQPGVATELRGQLHDQMKKSLVPVSEADANQLLAFFFSPPGVIFILVFFFLLSTLLPAFGGAVGAKLFRRN